MMKTRLPLVMLLGLAALVLLSGCAGTAPTPTQAMREAEGQVPAQPVVVSATPTPTPTPEPTATPTPTPTPTETPTPTPTEIPVVIEKVNDTVVKIDHRESDYYWFAKGVEYPRIPATQQVGKERLAVTVLSKDGLEAYDAVVFLYFNQLSGFENEFKWECVYGNASLCEDFVRQIGLEPELGVPQLHVEHYYMDFSPFLLTVVGINRKGRLLQGEATVLQFPSTDYKNIFRIYRYRESVLARKFNFRAPTNGLPQLLPWLRTSPNNMVRTPTPTLTPTPTPTLVQVEEAK